ncbi:hypothetical protein EVAR_47396_1 [Eumeta japonica]|uniref:Uncharacterized protein n=1 Tax=Eumeta variegata TaxID=151549 RepID=A0A4C1XYM5_EUMVA|nr:hypothetical protein EVAR_47396_1 [Eumeta japonica]
MKGRPGRAPQSQGSIQFGDGRIVCERCTATGAALAPRAHPRTLTRTSDDRLMPIKSERESDYAEDEEHYYGYVAEIKPPGPDEHAFAPPSPAQLMDLSAARRLAHGHWPAPLAARPLRLPAHPLHPVPATGLFAQILLRRFRYVRRTLQRSLPYYDYIEFLKVEQRRGRRPRTGGADHGKYLAHDKLSYAFSVWRMEGEWNGQTDRAAPPAARLS